MIHDFMQKLHESEATARIDKIMQFVADGIPSAAGWKKAEINDDRSGTDYWILRNGLPAISVDMKNRQFCPIDRYRSDDACIETTSVYRGQSGPPWEDRGRLKLGWTIDAAKRTDLIVYTWPTKNSAELRFWILYFPHLCAAATAHWRRWAADYGERPARNAGYTTLSIYPPRKVIANAMRELVSAVN